MDRSELFKALGVVVPDPPQSRVAERTTEIYEHQARLAHTRSPAGVLDDAPHGKKWHTSFHASQFPGYDGCARQQLYSLLDVPDEEPTPAWLIGISDAGKDLEVQFVRRWMGFGVTLKRWSR